MIDPVRLFTTSSAHAIQRVRNDLKQTVKTETSEFIKSAQKQGVPVSEKPIEAPKFELFPAPEKEISDEEKKKIENESRSMLQKLESELASVREQRKTRDQEWAKLQTQKMNPEEVPGKEQPKREIIIPKSKPPIGMMAIKRKQGSREQGKQISG